LINETNVCEYFEIAPGEGKLPKSIISDLHCEELAFPILISKGKYGYTAKRDINLSPTRYFNQRLLITKTHFHLIQITFFCTICTSAI